MKRLTIFAAALFAATALHAQDVESVLAQIEHNNKNLEALRRESEAAKLEVRTQNNLEDPSVEYSPFFAHGADGIASSEFVVSQGFDFPTLYAARHKSNRLQQEGIDSRYGVARRDVLLEAQLLCFEAIRLDRERQLLERRMENADEMLSLFEQRLEQGDATALEVNKIRMERMNAAAELSRNATARTTVAESLRAMNGDKSVSLEGAGYPMMPSIGSFDEFREKMMADELELQVSLSDERTAAQQVKVNAQNWLPKLEVGYRRNTDLDAAVNGFLVGASFPIFSSRHKSGAAKARYAASQLRTEDVKAQTEARIRSLYNSVEQSAATMRTYDLQLMRSTLDLLRRAVESGELSVIEYYVEADGIYSNMLSYVTVENTYYCTLAQIFRNDL